MIKDFYLYLSVSLDDEHNKIFHSKVAAETGD
jgi:hypothetical protein